MATVRWDHSLLQFRHARGGALGALALAFLRVLPALRFPIGRDEPPTV